jgi:NADH:ubiquinone oxidoreductase subunit 5 (subunit L)/multisubunit Na+/H+ antiporter MnhA subunit
MENYLIVLILLPLISFIISVFIPKEKEELISRVAFLSIGLYCMFLLASIIYVLFVVGKSVNINETTIFSSDNYVFFIDFFFDKITFLFLFLGSTLTLLVTTYSRYYLHKEKGYKRFFNTILFFFLGFNIVIASGNFETLFIGWEIIGISSFLLIAFYRERYLPVTNAFKVFSMYRIGDIGIILAMWASHHLWHENITFYKLSNYLLVSEHLQAHTIIGLCISLALLFAALVKSAQFPFSSWLPRAMEGPTPSSAIFYGSLSVHLGAFLLLRTYPFWEHQVMVRVLIIFIGLITSVSASLIARVQSSVKAQVAYSSIAQIGIIFIEIALGLHILALVHIAGNAFLRTYQLLVSPSVVSYLIKEQFYSFEKKEHVFEESLTEKLKNSIFLLSLNEFKLESIMSFVFWKPLKKLSSSTKIISTKLFIIGYVLLYAIAVGLYLSGFNSGANHILSIVFASFAVFSAIKAFAETQSPFAAWFLVIFNHLWIVIAILFNQNIDVIEIVLYLSGVLFAAIVGILALYTLQKQESIFYLKKYLGHIYEHKKLAFIFFLAAIGISGFPITTTFIGEDLIFSHIKENQVVLAVLVSQSFIIGGIAAIRIYARLFLGIHCKAYHELPNQNS